MSIVNEATYNIMGLHKHLIREGQWSPNSRQPFRMGSDWFIPIGYTDHMLGKYNQLKQFLEIPELNAVINIRAKAMASWQLNITSDRTGLPQPQNQSLVRVLRQPNWFQTHPEFWRLSSIYRDIWGNEYIYFLTPEGRPNTYMGLFTLDPSRMDVEYKSETEYFMTTNDSYVAYKYRRDGGTTIPLEKADLVHLNDNRVQSGNRNFLKGTSKIDSLMPALENIRAAYKKRGIILRMPVGVLSNKQSDSLGISMPMDESHKAQTQAELASHGALPIITNLNVDYSKMELSARAMGLFEEVIEDTGRICDAYGVPYKLLSSVKAGTLNNSGGDVREAKKQMYEDNIIPDCEEKLNAINNHIESGSRSWSVTMDFSHLPVFSEDRKTRADTLKTLVEALDKMLDKGVITIEQYKQEISKFGIKD